MLPDEFTDRDKAAVVQAIRDEGYSEAHEKMLVEASVAVMKFIEEEELSPEELPDSQAENILEDVDVNDSL